MISRRLQPVPAAGYYEYLSRIRHRVNVTPYEGTDSETAMTQTTSTASPSVTSTMDNDNTTSVTNSFSADNSQEQSINLNGKDITQWSSTEVQHWVEEQCQKFELKKATTEKFQMNGQALVLLTKHDFLRRSPDGGEVLYYALRRLIHPERSNIPRSGQTSSRNASSYQSTRIVEVNSDSDDDHNATGFSSSGKPIIEEPDDPPLPRSSESETNFDTHQHQYYSHSFFHNHAHMHPQMFAMPNAAYYHQHHQHPAFPNGFVYAHHHVHAHMPQQQQQQQFFHPQSQAHFIHQYHPMMAAQGILIEVLDNEEANNLTGNGANSDAREQLYIITMNGQRYVMDEEQIRKYVAQIQHQQQQHYQQHQHFHQQQQQQFHQQQQQQQYTYQQPQPSQDNIFHTS